MIVSSYISDKTVKGETSQIQGRGLFARAPISAGEIVAIKGGHIVDTAALHALPARLQNSEIQIADGSHLVALQDAEYGPVMLFINHSCEPNVGFAGNVVLVAMRDIRSGEERLQEPRLASYLVLLGLQVVALAFSPGPRRGLNLITRRSIALAIAWIATAAYAGRIAPTHYPVPLLITEIGICVVVLAGASQVALYLPPTFLGGLTALVVRRTDRGRSTEAAGAC